MSNYFDNQTNWSWNVDPGKSVTLTTNHGPHSHTLDLTDVKIGDMQDKPGITMGNAHRSVSHDPISENMSVLQDLENSPSKNSEVLDKSSSVLDQSLSGPSGSYEDGGINKSDTGESQGEGSEGEGLQEGDSNAEEAEGGTSVESESTGGQEM